MILAILVLDAVAGLHLSKVRDGNDAMVIAAIRSVGSPLMIRGFRSARSIFQPVSGLPFRITSTALAFKLY